MKKSHIPDSLTILNGAMAMDVGSINLLGLDSGGNAFQIYLDWSLDAQAAGTTTLSLNNIPLEKGSPEEKRLLEVLASAEIQFPEQQGSEEPAPIQGAIMGEDINQYLDAINAGPEAALENLVGRLITNVKSKLHAGTRPSDKKKEPVETYDGACDICGRPGYVQAHPSEPISVVRCEEHSGTRTFNPISILFNTVVLLGFGLLLFLIYSILF